MGRHDGPRFTTTVCGTAATQDKHRIKTQTVLPNAVTASMLFWALLTSGQIVTRKIDGWETLTEFLSERCIDLAA